MPWAPDYATLEEARRYLRVPPGDTSDDAYIAGLITAASRTVDAACRRQFGTASGVRTYPASWAAQLVDGTGWTVDVDDVPDASTATVTVAGTPAAVTWWPFNAVANGHPYRAVRMTTAPTGDIVVTADFGWTAVPVQVTGAVLLQVARWFARRESPFGVAGSPGEGSELRLLSRLDPDVPTMLLGLIRYRRTG